MKTTRTEFLVTVAGGLAATALSPGGLLAAPLALDAEGFKALVGETFTFRGSDGREPAVLVLTACQEVSAKYGRSQFTLTLVSDAGDALGEGTYAVDNRKTGTFDLFVVPTGRDAKGRTLFRADFNLSAPVTGSGTTVVRRR